jgi:hypothetical protein
MCHYLGGGLHGRQKRVKAQSESSKSVVNSVLISREMPVFPGFLEIIRVVMKNTKNIKGVVECARKYFSGECSNNPVWEIMSDKPAIATKDITEILLDSLGRVKQ